MKKALVVSLASMMMLQTFGTSIPVMAADETSICAAQEEDQGYIDDTTKGLIHFGVGKIPVVGELADIIGGGLLDDLVDAIFGNSGAGDNQLAELKNQLTSISIDIENNAREQLETLYEMSFDSLNKDFTAVRRKTIQSLNNIESFTSNTALSDPEKALEIALMFDLNSTNLADFTNVVATAADYVSGINVSPSKPESLLVRAFKCSCSKYDMVGNAALKASGYVNQLATILESAYKVEATVLDSKFFLADYAKQHPEEYKALEEKYSKDTQRSSLLAQAKLEGPVSTWKTSLKDITDMTNLIFNKDDSRSVINRYNQMIKNYWFCFIKAVDIHKNYAEVSLKPMSANLTSDTLDAMGSMRENYKKLFDEQLFNNRSFMEKIYTYADANFDNVDSILKNSGLNSEESEKLMKNLMDNAPNITGDETEKNPYKVLLDYGFHVDNAVKEMAHNFDDPTMDGLTSDQIVEKFKPILIWEKKKGSRPYTYIYTFLVGHDFETNEVQSNTRILPIKPKEGKSYPLLFSEFVFDPTQHVFLAFREDNNMPDDPWAGYKGEPFQAIQESMKANMDEALFCTYVYVPAETDTDPENNDIEDEETAITLTVDENGQISGDQMNEAWTVAEDGTIILNKDNKFRFEGTVADKNIQNYGEIVDGNFKNVKLELVNNAVITKGTFEDCEITTNENAVIGEEVELINTTIIDANNIENKEEEEQKEDPQEVVEETPVSENEMF